MSTRPLIVGKIALQGPTQRSLVPHHNVVQALASDGAHQPFRKGILPARSVPTVEFDRKKFEKVSQSISTAVGTLRIPVCSSPWPIPKRSLRILPSACLGRTTGAHLGRGADSRALTQWRLKLHKQECR